ncbi:MAG: YetF domain-containing protein [Arthrobacter sp.]
MSNDPWYSLGITPVEALWVVVSAVGIYAVFFLLIRGFGQRSLASWSTLDKAIVIALGGVVGRVILGYTPTLAAGIVGLVSLFAMMRLEEYLRRTKRGVYLSSRPVLLMAGDEILADNLKKARIQNDELYFKLRQAGIHNFSEVSVVLLEPTGDVSVLRRGVPVDRELLRRVADRDRIPGELLLPEPDGRQGS